MGTVMEDVSWLTFAVIILVAATVSLLVMRRRSTAGQSQTVYQWQTGLLYRNGVFEREVGPGRYWLLFNRAVYVVSRTEQPLGVSAQEVLSQDRLQFKLSAVVRYLISEPRRLFEDTAGRYNDTLTVDLQLALRELASVRTLEQLIAERPALDTELLALLKARCEPRGVVIKSAAVRDIILSADLRRLYAEQERARLEGQAALERARGEQAALRSLANSARMLKGNPELMNLRLLHALAGQPGKASPTIVLGGAQGLMPVQPSSGDAATD